MKGGLSNFQNIKYTFFEIACNGNAIEFFFRYAGQYAILFMGSQYNNITDLFIHRIKVESKKANDYKVEPRELDTPLEESEGCVFNDKKRAKKIVHENRNIYPEQIGPQEKYHYTLMYDPEHMLNLPNTSPNKPIEYEVVLETQYSNDSNLYTQPISNKKRKLDECYSNPKIEYSINDSKREFIEEKYLSPIFAAELPTQGVWLDADKSNNFSLLSAFDNSGISTAYY